MYEIISEKNCFPLVNRPEKIRLFLFIEKTHIPTLYVLIYTYMYIFLHSTINFMVDINFFIDKINRNSHCFLRFILSQIENIGVIFC